MASQELRFSDGDLIWMRIEWIPAFKRLEFTEADGRVWNLDRDKSHLLLLYLQEHLGASK